MTTHAYPTPPVHPPSWEYNAKSIEAQIHQTIATTNRVLDSIAALAKQERTFETVLRPIAFRDAQMQIETGPLTFLQHVDPRDDVRDASVKAEKDITDHATTSISQVDIYEAILDAKSHTEVSGINLTPEEQRLLDRYIRDRIRKGLHLSPEDREKFVSIQQEIDSLCIDFNKTCSDEHGFLLFTKEELDGVPEGVISGYPKEGDKFCVTFKYPDIFPVLEYATNPLTRKVAQQGFENKNKSNTPLLPKIITLRREAASLLGFTDWASYIIEVKMAKSAENVWEFLNQLEAKLMPLGIREKEKLINLKLETEGSTATRELHIWDHRFYDRLWKKNNLKLDKEQIKEYFPVSKVVPKILEIYCRLLNVKFFPVPKTKEFGGETWYEDVEMHAVWSGGEDGQHGEFLGYIHLDLYPRQNKYGHAAIWDIMPGFTKEDRSRAYPVVCMVANLAKPTPTLPALMNHKNVVTFFHEMGHAFHSLCSKTQFAEFHGSFVSWDFVEAPSQMLENWCWTAEILKEMSSHFERPGEHLPDELIHSLIASKSVNQGLNNLRQIFLAKYDMILHTSKEDQDLTKLWCDLREATSLVSTAGEYVPGQSGFAHIVGGYAAGYYGYLYSQSFSADMFTTIFSANPMDQEKGLLYRETILKPGGSRDEMESLVAFLGREPTSDAFLKELLRGANDS